MNLALQQQQEKPLQQQPQKQQQQHLQQQQEKGRQSIIQLSHLALFILDSFSLMVLKKCLTVLGKTLQSPSRVCSRAPREFSFQLN